MKRELRRSGEVLPVDEMRSLSREAAAERSERAALVDGRARVVRVDAVPTQRPNGSSMIRLARRFPRPAPVPRGTRPHFEVGPNGTTFRRVGERVIAPRIDRAAQEAMVDAWLRGERYADREASIPPREPAVVPTSVPVPKKRRVAGDERSVWIEGPGKFRFVVEAERGARAAVALHFWGSRGMAGRVRVCEGSAEVRAAYPPTDGWVIFAVEIDYAVGRPLTIARDGESIRIRAARYVGLAAKSWES